MNTIADREPSRRALMGTATAALLAGAAIATAAQGERVGLPDGTADPVLPLFRQWRALEDRSAVVWAKLQARRQANPGTGVSDPESLRLIRESDRLTGTITDLLERLMLTPAITAAGALAKLRIAAEVWPLTRPPEEFEFHEDVARDAILDAVRLIGRTAT